MPPTVKYGGDLRQAHLPDEQVILGHRSTEDEESQKRKMSGHTF
jgi:hypothetical protein